tara:strand:- start:3665 stop:5047 length:1383 start_codon:yes stop_codon:yes gene_type:complete
MAAIVTDRLKLKIVDSIVTAFKDASIPHYVGLGRSEYWNALDTVVTPVNTAKEERDFMAGLQSIKRLTGVSHVIKRVNWVKGTIYHQWDDTKTSYTNDFYVLNDNFHVYICLRTGRNALGNEVPSLIQPTNSNNDPFQTSDGYVWKFLYTISELEARQFMTAAWMPTRVITATDSNSSGVEIKQKEIQDTAQPRRITSIVLVNKGTGYNSAPSVSVVGVDARGNSLDSAQLGLTSTVDSQGRIAKIEFNTDSSTLDYGLNEYANATITIGAPDSAGGVQATARAVISPRAGFGANAMHDLQTSGFALHCKIDGADDDFILGNDFRQIGVIQRPKKMQAADSDFIGNTGLVLKHLKTNMPPNNVFSVDKLIVGASSGAKAYVDKVDSDKIYYHQTDVTGFTLFQNGEVLTESNGTGNGTIDSARIDGEVLPYSGDLLYLNNRGAIERSTNQSEDIKIILQL